MSEIVTPGLARWLRVALRLWIVLATIWLSAETVESINRAVFFSRRTARESAWMYQRENDARYAPDPTPDPVVDAVKKRRQP